MENLVIELSDTKKALLNLASKIQQSKQSTKPNWREIEETETSINAEIEQTRHELRKIKRDMARVQKAKRHADRAWRASNSKRLTLLASVELMKKENEELRLMSGTEELDGAKQELEFIKGKGFNFMTSMDAIRDELKRVRGETERLLKTEQVRDSTIQTLNSKILRAKSKLESLASLESKTDTVALNLGFALEQLRFETEIVIKEKDVINEEIEDTIREIQETEHESEVTEGRLEAAIEELEAIKLLESEALGNLRNVINRAMEAREIGSVNSLMITITEFEYGYLTGKAGEAAEVADKKIDAAQAWVEALKANEREVLMKIEMTEREISKLSIEIGPEAEAEGSEPFEPRPGPGLEERVVASGRRPMYRVGSKAAVKRVRLKRFRASGARKSGKTGSVRRDRVMPKLV